jgi:hypothetical protein
MLRVMDEIAQNKPAPPEWIAQLEESEADVAAGRVVPLEPALARIRASLERMRARRAGEAKRSSSRE